MISCRAVIELTTIMLSGHSMVLDHTAKVLYIFAGQQEDRYLSDMYSYDIRTGIACEIFNNFSTSGGPEACFTPRAVIDPTVKEIYVISGLTKTKVLDHVSSQIQSSRAVLKDRMHNWVYKYDTQPGKWTEISKAPEKPVNQRPMPRFAHQVVFNPKTKAMYMHGGNGGELNKDGVKDGTKGRLDDFWRMELRRYSFFIFAGPNTFRLLFIRSKPEEIIRQCKFAILQQQYVPPALSS